MAENLNYRGLLTGFTKNVFGFGFVFSPHIRNSVSEAAVSTAIVELIYAITEQVGI